MQICGMEKFSMVDYEPYIVCTVFTNGCNFVCPFCQNSSLVINTANNALIDNEEVFDYLKKRKGLVDGVCVSGGEPTLQADLIEFISRVKSMGYRVKLDTNGARPEVLKRLLELNLLDYVAMDIKNSPDKYAQTVGSDVDIKQIKRSIKMLIDGDIDYEFRTTLIAEFHDKKAMEAIAALIAGAKKYYMQKYVDSEDCICNGFCAVDIQTVNQYKQLFEGVVGKVGIRGYSQ